MWEGGIKCIYNLQWFYIDDSWYTWYTCIADYIWDLKTKKMNVCETNTHIIYHFLPAFRKVVKKSWLIFCDEPRIMLKPDYDVWLYKYLPYGSMSL